MGADIRIDGHTAVVHGAKPLEGAPVMATDLRASVCLVVAALGADNTTRLQRVYHLDRGYERLERKLAGIGADIERVSPRPAEAAAPRVEAATDPAARPVSLVPPAGTPRRTSNAS